MQSASNLTAAAVSGHRLERAWRLKFNRRAEGVTERKSHQGAAPSVREGIRHNVSS